MGKPLQIFAQIVVALCIGGTSLAQVSMAKNSLS